jgi:molybdate transport system substrate-binding protein
MQCIRSFLLDPGLQRANRPVSTTLLLNLSALLSSLIAGFFVSFLYPALAQSDGRDLLVAGASDLAAIQAPLADGFRKAGGGRVRFTLGSSGMLARQIAQGAPYDVFLSADEGRVRELESAGRLDPGSVTTYALGRLAVWSKSGEYKTLGDLTRPGLRHVALANPSHAPYGAAAKQALERAGLWNQLSERVVYGESVRQAYEYAASGNADATITAWSLVFEKGGAMVPAALHDPIRQTGGVVKGSRNAQSAREFLRYLAGAEGQALLGRSGFSAAR